jgi:hypothetical protein
LSINSIKWFEEFSFEKNNILIGSRSFQSDDNFYITSTSPANANLLETKSLQTNSNLTKNLNPGEKQLLNKLMV